jgi:serine protease Do
MRALHWIILGCLASNMGGAYALEADKIFETLEPSIWVVTTFDAQEQRLAQGSAVVIARERLVTNCHVLAKAKSVVIKRGNIAYGAKLEHVDTERDLCQLRADEHSAAMVEVAPVDSLKVGQRVFALGSPQGRELSLSDGIISSLRKSSDGELEMIQTTAPLSPGSSGGGLFDIHGRLIGLTTMIRRDAQNLNIAIPAAWIAELPERSREALAKDAQQRSIAQSANVQPVAVVERQIVQGELIEHFGTPRRVTATTNLADNVTFRISGNGTVEFKSNVQSGVNSRGSYKVNSRGGEMCIVMPQMLNNTFNMFQWMKGCYKLFTTGPNQYVLRSVKENYYIKYGT